MSLDLNQAKRRRLLHLAEVCFFSRLLCDKFCTSVRCHETIRKEQEAEKKKIEPKKWWVLEIAASGSKIDVISADVRERAAITVHVC